MVNIISSVNSRVRSPIKSTLFPYTTLFRSRDARGDPQPGRVDQDGRRLGGVDHLAPARDRNLEDRKSTRLNSSHSQISYAVFCLKKKNITSSVHTRDMSSINTIFHELNPLL